MSKGKEGLHEQRPYGTWWGLKPASCWCGSERAGRRLEAQAAVHEAEAASAEPVATKNWPASTSTSEFDSENRGCIQYTVGDGI
jgi:hypothetical protein